MVRGCRRDEVDDTRLTASFRRNLTLFRIPSFVVACLEAQLWVVAAELLRYHSATFEHGLEPTQAGWMQSPGMKSVKGLAPGIPF